MRAGTFLETTSNPGFLSNVRPTQILLIYSLEVSLFLPAKINNLFIAAWVLLDVTFSMVAGRVKKPSVYWAAETGKLVGRIEPSSQHRCEFPHHLDVDFLTKRMRVFLN